MGQVLHGSAAATEVVRERCNIVQESLRELAKRHGINRSADRIKPRCSTAISALTFTLA